MVLVTLTHWAAEYNECAARQQALVETVQAYENKEK